MKHVNLLYNHVPVRKLTTIYKRYVPEGWNYGLHKPLISCYFTEHEADRIVRKLSKSQPYAEFYAEVYR